MLFFYTLVSWIEIGLTIPSQMASEADFLHLKVDKKVPMFKIGSVG